MISHSGSLSNILGIMAPEKAIRFSKVVSLGNECDLSVADFLGYLARDSKTHVVGGYIEGIQHGPTMLAALKANLFDKTGGIMESRSDGRRAHGPHRLIPGPLPERKISGKGLPARGAL